ncbi:MAG: hypothetical protein IT569_05365, partial [Leptospiraceae bacterium]|nr:hypothetical protein [Leptospiraceae bacterium]
MNGRQYLKGLSKDILDFLDDLDSRTKEFLKREIRLTDGVRTYAQQKYLWDNRHNNPYPVGNPNNKNLPHYHGRAVDVSWNDFKDVQSVYTQLISKTLAKHPSIVWGGIKDPVHFYVSGKRRPVKSKSSNAG